MEYRKQRQEKDHLLATNMEQISDLQKNIAERIEKINQLEQYSTDFKASQKELLILLEVLEMTKSQLEKQTRDLSGTLITLAAFCSYCGSKESWQRKELLR